MSEVTATITIAASPQRVFDTIMDPDRLKDWVTIHRSVTVLTDDPLRAGAQMDQVLSLRGLSVTVHWTLDSVQAPHVAEWRGRGPAGATARIRYALSGPDTGPTTFAYTNEFATPGGRIGMAATRVVVGGTSEREARKSLERLKTVLEK
jgi:uncharacterized protein YndB with AHSA1/START domain